MCYGLITCLSQTILGMARLIKYPAKNPCVVKDGSTRVTVMLALGEYCSRAIAKVEFKRRGCLLCARSSQIRHAEA